MSDVETLAERVRTVERAVTDGDHDLSAAEDLAALTERVGALERDVAKLEDRADELEAATQALRGYVGNVRSVNERVEGRADTALAATERLERRLDELEAERSGGPERHDRRLGGTAGVDPVDADGGEPSPADVRTNGERAADATDDRATASRDPSVVERIRSLL